MVLLSSGTHFTNVLWAHKCNLARIYLALIWITMALSRHSFAHAFCRGMCDIVNYLNNSFHFYLNLNEQMKVIRRVHWTLHKQHICMWSSRDWDIYQVPHYLSLFLPLSPHTHTYIYIYICVCVWMRIFIVPLISDLGDWPQDVIYSLYFMYTMGMTTRGLELPVLRTTCSTVFLVIFAALWYEDYEM